MDNPQVIRDYLADEVALSRMSGPYTISQVEHELGGFFVSCPLGLVEKAGEPGKFRIIRDLSYHNKEDGYSVNEHLDADDFPTEWGTAAQVAEIVSTSFHAHICAFSGASFASCTLCALFCASFAFRHICALEQRPFALTPLSRTRLLSVNASLRFVQRPFAYCTFSKCS
jgi:hypothetical protein